MQGVGFRPFVWHLANQLACTGWVRNAASGVEIEAQGSPDAIELFIGRLCQQPPPLAQIFSIVQRPLEYLANEKDFQIVSSDMGSQPWALVSADVAVCQDCLFELMDCSNRRYRYPFINCTNCGPRFTIQQSVPYDRQQTTMQPFMMCDSCLEEYQTPANRRFHAQPNACFECGPSISYYRPSDNETQPLTVIGGGEDTTISSGISRSEAVIQNVRRDINAGRIVAIKGIGGFHLACDACQSDAIRRLRQRKNRAYKPLAIMVRDLATAGRIVHLSPLEQQLLSSPQRPIVLLPKRQVSQLSQLVAPNNSLVGMMLPYSPLHYLLLEQGDMWVMTSGNLADEPIAYEDQDAISRLQRIADSFLLHNRQIYTACDDSVTRASRLGPLPIRRSRGYAPLPIRLDDKGPSVLAVGGDSKAALCLAAGDRAYLAQHLGDMGNRETVLALDRSYQHLRSLYRIDPMAYVCDQHPGYLSVTWAEAQARQAQVPLLRVQHHHAHAAALLAEHQRRSDSAMIACVLDGTGYGDDGCIWGGEILIADAFSYRRVAHLQYLPLPGGDQCIQHPARAAVAFLYAAGLPFQEKLPCIGYFSELDLRRLQQQLNRQINVVSTSSIGRLFDAVASLIGLRHSIDYEGQAASELEALAETALKSSVQDQIGDLHFVYPFCWSAAQPRQLHYGPMLSAICDAMIKRQDPAIIALKFHITVARAFSEQCARIRAENLLADPNADLNCVGLTGGVFQNALLIRLMHEFLASQDFRVLTHSVVPANDGGLALGQALIGREWLKRHRLE